MNFVESRLLGIQIDEKAHTAFLSLKTIDQKSCIIELSGVERILVNDFRELNVIEDIFHWTRTDSPDNFREAVFFLLTGASEKDCDTHLSKSPLATIERVKCGDLEILDVTAVFGAQVIASFASMRIKFS